MILILSTEADISTNRVIEWLRYWKQEYLRINDTDKIEIDEVYLDNNDCYFDLTIHMITGTKTHLSSRDISGYWYRRGELSANTKYHISENEMVESGLNAHNLKNYKTIYGFLYFLLMQKNIKYIGSIFDNQTNKLVNLQYAKAVGLQIPKTYILQKKSRLLELVKIDKMITKSVIDANILYLDKDLYLWSHTKVINEDFKKVPNFFFPTLFQPQIDKKFELRIFFLNGRIYTTAIKRSFRFCLCKMV